MTFAEQVLAILDRAIQGQPPPADVSRAAATRADALIKLHRHERERAAAKPPTVAPITAPAPSAPRATPASQPTPGRGLKLSVELLTALVDAVAGTQGTARAAVSSGSGYGETAQILALKSWLYHAGVRHPQLDFAGVVPRESRLERGPRLIALANRKAAVFLATLTGEEVPHGSDAQTVEAARAFMVKTTGKTFVCGAKL